MNRLQIFTLIDKERSRQDKLHGESNRSNSDSAWALIMGEEYGEICKAVLELNYQYPNATKEDIKKEIIETIAVGVAWLEHQFIGD